MEKYLKQKKYNKLAKDLIDAGFNIYGKGNFDIALDEIAELLKLLNEKGDIKSYYEHLSKKYLCKYTS